MTWKRILLPWRLTSQNFIALVAAVGIILFIIALLQLQELSHSQISAGDMGILINKFQNVHGHMGEHSEKEDLTVFQHLERKWKEPEWQIAKILQMPQTRQKELVPVIVVEEHFEVLKYWFDAVQTGVIPKSGNTLLHIDGHSDDAPPRDMLLIPWFHLPENHSEVANMMQTNDAFIAGSALAGLINRFIWIWPDWDKEEHKNDSDHEIKEFKAGWRTYYPTNGKPFRRLCVCEKNHSVLYTQNATEKNVWKCWDDEPDKSLKGKGPLIRSQQCSTELTGMLEYIHERKALELLEQGGWIQEEESLLLDIDEDYYGCESSVIPLYKVGLSQKIIDTLSELVGNFLCVSDVHSEFIADKVFHSLLLIVKESKVRLCSGQFSPINKSDCLSDFDADKALIQLIPSIVYSLKKAGIEELLCELRTSDMLLQVLLRTLYKLNIEQLDALSFTGVCLITAPTNLQFEPDSLHICHGFNIPGETEVLFYVPTHEENKARSKLLQNSLSLLPKQPLLVTVCRSIRDGYTPWALFDYIEQTVLGILETVFKDVNQTSFHYDENLLGNKNGWPGRHKQLTS